MKYGKAVFGAMSALFFAGIVFTGYKLYDVYRGYEQAEAEYTDLRDKYRSKPAPDMPVISEFPAEDVPKAELPAERPWGDFPEISVDVDSLYAENPDFYAWMYFADGKVDLPVMQEPAGDENVDYYLRRGFDKQSLSAGCLFASNELPFTTNRSNFYIYGHNMKNGSMFGSLDDVYNGGLAGLTDPYFYLYNKDHERIKYRILAMYDTSDEEGNPCYDSPIDPASYDAYLDLILSEGSVEEKFPFTEWEAECMEMRSQMCSLYACYGKHGSGRRLFVHGLEIGREPFEPALQTGGDGV